MALDLGVPAPRPDWRLAAACTGMAPSLFMPTDDGDEQCGAAARICASCEVRLDCLLDAFATGERMGIRGGYTETQRRGMLRRLRAWHRTGGEIPDGWWSALGDAVRDGDDPTRHGRLQTDPPLSSAR
jgi:WhiB family redox-sensing transcriptional regulator